MTVAQFIEQLQQLPHDTIVLIGKWNPRYQEYDDLEPPAIGPSMFVEEDTDGTFRDVTDREREFDIPAIVIV